MKKVFLSVCTILMVASLAGQNQNLVVGSSDVIGFPVSSPGQSYLLEGDRDLFYSISGSYNSIPVHPLLNGLLDSTGSIYFIQYNKLGEALKSNHIKGTSNPVRAFSFEGGLQLLGGAYYDIDANGQALPINEADYMEFIASYDKDCQLYALKNIWNLPRSVYPNSDAALDARDGSIYIYGSTNQMILDVDGFGPIGENWNGSFLYVLKYNRNLDFMWAYTAGFETDTIAGYFPASDLRVIPGINGNVLVCGTYYSNGIKPLFGSETLPYVDNGQGVFAVELNSSGKQSWVRSGENHNWEYYSRIEKGFSLSNGEYILSGATSTGYFRLGEAEFIFEGDVDVQNQFVFRMGPGGSVKWSLPLASMGRSGSKKKAAGAEDFNAEIYSDALLWNEDVLYVTGTYQSPSFIIAEKPLPVTFKEQFFIASIDPEDGRELWGYGFSSDLIQLHGFDVDRTGNVSIMGVSSDQQEFNGGSQVTGPASRLIFHLGLDYRGRLLWYNNAFLQNQNSQIRGSDLVVLPNGEIFSSVQVSAPEILDIGEQTLIADFPYTNWLVGLKARMDLSGQVLDESGLPVFPGYVKAYRSAPSRAYPVVDSVPINDAGIYSFKHLYPGHYTLQVFPDRIKYPNLAPSYIGDQVVWTDAQFNDFGPDFSSSALDINVAAVPVLTAEDGKGSISGQVSYEGNLKSTLGRPVKKASVMLLKKSKKSTQASGDLLGYFETDDLGNYVFENVPDGDYILIVDITGLPMVQVYEVTIQGEQIKAGLDYEVGTDGIVIPGGVDVETKTADEFLLFPNPGDGRIQMDFKNPGDYVVRVFGTDGRLVSSMDYPASSGQCWMDISKENQGIYLIVIQGPETSATVRYFKK